MHPVEVFLVILGGVLLTLHCYRRIRYGSWIGASFGARVVRFVASASAKTKYAFPYLVSIYVLDGGNPAQRQIGLLIEGQIPSRSTYKRALRLSNEQALELSNALAAATNREGAEDHFDPPKNV
jgi:hypothetical protein